MSDERRAGALARIAERLIAARWLLGAGLLGIALVAWSGGGPLALLAAACLVGVAALSPVERSSRVRTSEAPPSSHTGLADLSAARLAAAVPDPLIIFDRAGVAVYVNAAAEQSFANVREGIELQLRFRTPEMQDLVRRTLAGEGSVAPIDHFERLPIERQFRVSAAAIGEGSGLFVLVLKDQSESRRIDRMRADFIANASHELRTPLATISGFIETLRGPARDDAAARERFLGIMHNQTLRMARLIDDLLSLSRIEMKPFVTPGETVDLKLVLGTVLDSLAHLATEYGMTVERHFPGEAVMVPGSRDELFQVFENLVENAFKYGQSGGRVDVSIRRGGAKREVEVEVRDYGPGIAEEHIPRITERFYRVDVEGSRPQKGTGLGLSIVKHILTRHNARLAIRSRLGEGATFTVTLPST